MKTIHITVFMILAALVISVPVFAETTSGPFAQYGDDDAGNITIVWETDVPEASGVSYVDESGNPHKVQDDVETTRHEVTLHVEPGEWITYSVDDSIYSVRARPLACEEVHFLLVGDTRSGHDTHTEIVGQMLQVPDVDFYLHSGDMVSRSRSESQWERFFEIEMPMMQQAVILPAVGNHDGSRNRPGIYSQGFVLPEPELYYVIQWGTVSVISLDGHVNTSSGNHFNDDQMEWLMNVLQSIREDDTVEHVIVMAHVGPYGSSRGRGGSAQMRDLLDEFARSKVSLIVSGHDHLYEGGFTENGILYVVSAGGGASLYTPRSDRAPDQGNEVLAVSSVHHIVEVTISGSTVDVTATDLEGNVISTISTDSTNRD